MTVEIRELIIKVDVTESSPASPLLSANGYSEWDEQRLLDKLKQEVLEYLLERGCL